MLPIAEVNSQNEKNLVKKKFIKTIGPLIPMRDNMSSEVFNTFMDQMLEKRAHLKGNF